VVRVGDKVILLRGRTARDRQRASHARQQTQEFEASSEQVFLQNERFHFENEIEFQFQNQ